MPRKKKAAPNQAPASPDSVEMVAGPNGFSCRAHEGDVSGGAAFTTTEARAALLESRNLAARKG